MGVTTVRVNTEGGKETPSHLTSPRRAIHHQLSSPAAPLRHSDSPDQEEGGVVRTRPISFNIPESESVEADLSKSVTPQHRKLLQSIASGGGSPKLDRPKVSGLGSWILGWGGLNFWGGGVGGVLVRLEWSSLLLNWLT